MPSVVLRRLHSAHPSVHASICPFVYQVSFDSLRVTCSTRSGFYPIFFLSFFLLAWGGAACCPQAVWFLYLCYESFVVSSVEENSCCIVVWCSVCLLTRCFLPLSGVMQCSCCVPHLEAHLLTQGFCLGGGARHFRSNYGTFHILCATRNQQRGSRCSSTFWILFPPFAACPFVFFTGRCLYGMGLGL